MPIDWKALKSQKTTTSPFFAIILGPSGAGKSTLIGSLNKPTLYLYTSVENHGVVAAQALNKNVIPICIDRDDTGDLIDADTTFKRILSILVDPEIKNQVSAIALDGATELDQIVRKTRSFKLYCQTEKGGHNTYKEGEAVIVHLKQIVEAMKDLHSQGLHCFMTCAALVKATDMDGGVSEVTPKLLGFDSASDLIRQFQDVLLVSRQNIPDETTGEIKPVHVLSFHATINKTAKDLKGTVLKTANFSPRISGLLVEQLPALMRADLSELLKIKNK